MLAVVRIDRGILELGEYPVAQGQRLGATVQWHRKLLGTRDAEKVCDDATGEHQVVVADMDVAMQVQHPPAMVDVEDPALDEMHVGLARAQCTQEPGDVAGVETRCRDLGQQRLERVVDVPIDEHDFHGSALQRAYGRDATKAAPDYDDSGPTRGGWRLRTHGKACMPIP